MFIDELLVFVLQLLPALQVRDVLDLLRGGPRPLQLLEYALDVVPLLHLARGLAEGVGHHLPDANHGLLDLVLALLTARGAALGVFHDEPLLRHVGLAGETLMEVKPGTMVSWEVVFGGNRGKMTDSPGKIKQAYGWRLTLKA